MAMEVVLRKNVPDLGAVGDVVKVENGFARNYLLPRGLAYRVNAHNLRRLEVEKKKQVLEAQAEKDRALSLAAELKGRSFTIQAKATEEGHLYGSVDEDAVASVLAGEGVALPEKAVALEEPIKEVGIYEVGLRLHPEVEATTKVWVVTEGGEGKTGEAGGEEKPAEGDALSTDDVGV